MLPIASEIATRLTHEHAHSGRPDAPVVDVPVPTRAPRGRRRRLALARALRSLADRVEPAHAKPSPNGVGAPC